MKRIFFALIFLFFSSLCFSELNLDIGINGGIEQNIYDAREESFKAKFQYGNGFNSYIRAVFFRYVGVEFGFPGFFYTYSSDSSGDYYYPEKIKIPWNLKFLFMISYKGFNFEAGGGLEFPYYILASYYSPRYIILGFSFLGGVSYQFTERFSLGIRFNVAFYSDEYTSLNNSIYYLLNMSYRIF
ncbi:MAG: hypothetical protein ACP5QT_03460 [Brevinematia bacterium]